MNPARKGPGPSTASRVRFACHRAREQAPTKTWNARTRNQLVFPARPWHRLAAFRRWWWPGPPAPISACGYNASATVTPPGCIRPRRRQDATLSRPQGPVPGEKAWARCETTVVVVEKGQRPTPTSLTTMAYMPFRQR